MKIDLIILQWRKHRERNLEPQMFQRFTETGASGDSGE